MWEKIFDHLDENDLFPLALSCRHFRQKQKELVERRRESEPESEKPRRALTTTLHEWPVKDQPASARYLQFCRKEKVSSDCVGDRDMRIGTMAAFHGHLPLLQELLKPLKRSDPSGTSEAFLDITRSAGESSSSQSRLLLSFASDFFSSSQRAGAKWRPCSG